MSDELQTQGERPAEAVRVIKASDAAERAVESLFERQPRVVKSRVVNQLQELDAVVGSAREDAKRILREAESEAERMREEAREQGAIDAQRESLELLGKAQEVYDNAVRDAESDLLDMAFRLAERIIGTALEFEPELVRALVRDVVKRARGGRRVVVYVHPSDAQTLMSSREELVELLGGATLSIEGDESLTRGSCVLRTDAGDVDARLETRLEAIRRSIRGQ
ncbi:MAG: type III secretion system stator protein SctL [Myxococcota bacterium]